MLHITNGSSAGDTIATLGSGPVLTWDDTLHDGPVPAGPPLAALSAVRATYLAETVTTFAEAWGRFSRRDATIGALTPDDEVVLWFEADLYDQLQILQILDALPPVRLSMICIGEHSEVQRFIGLGQLTANQLAALYPTRQPVTPDQIELARRAWAAFRGPTPAAWSGLLDDDLSALPFLRDAVRRHLDELSATDTGLTRTEKAILELLPGSPVDLFQQATAREDRPYLGDTSFWSILARLASGTDPLITPFSLDESSPPSETFRAQRLSRTDRAAAVLAGTDRWVGPDRWWGGVALHNGQWPAG